MIRVPQSSNPGEARTNVYRQGSGGSPMRQKAGFRAPQAPTRGLAAQGAAGANLGAAIASISNPLEQEMGKILEAKNFEDVALGMTAMEDAYTTYQSTLPANHDPSSYVPGLQNVIEKQGEAILANDKMSNLAKRQLQQNFIGFQASATKRVSALALSKQMSQTRAAGEVRRQRGIEQRDPGQFIGGLDADPTISPVEREAIMVQGLRDIEVGKISDAAASAQYPIEIAELQKELGLGGADFVVSELTSYYPADAVDTRNAGLSSTTEGGAKDRWGNNIFNKGAYWEAYKEGKGAGYVTVAMGDEAGMRKEFFTSPQFPGVVFRNMDTGDYGKGKGRGWMDVASKNPENAKSFKEAGVEFNRISPEEAKDTWEEFKASRGESYDAYREKELKRAEDEEAKTGGLTRANLAEINKKLESRKRELSRDVKESANATAISEGRNLRRDEIEHLNDTVGLSDSDYHDLMYNHRRGGATPDPIRMQSTIKAMRAFEVGTEKAVDQNGWLQTEIAKMTPQEAAYLGELNSQFEGEKGDQLKAISDQLDKAYKPVLDSIQSSAPFKFGEVAVLPPEAEKVLKKQQADFEALRKRVFAGEFENATEARLSVNDAQKANTKATATDAFSGRPGTPLMIDEKPIEDVRQQALKFLGID